MEDKSSIKFFPWRIFSRLFLIQAALIFVALGASGLSARYFFKKSFIEQTENQLRDTLVHISAHLPSQVSKDWCAAQVTGTSIRLTLITKEGKVLCDSHHGPETMATHRDRPEIIQALSGGFGQSIRYSHTLQIEMLYGALYLPGKQVALRGGLPLGNLGYLIRFFDTSLALFLGALGLTLALFAVWSGRKFVFPIGRLLLKTQALLSRDPAKAPREEFSHDSYGELSDLESSLEDIRRDLEEKNQSLSREREIQATLMNAVSDAVLAVDLEGRMLFSNARFVLLFGAQKGQSLWELFREPEVLQAYELALKSGKSGTAQVIIQPSGRFFSVSVSPLHKENDGIYGAVGLFHDVSELKQAEQMRIDFVANVSHELRTPLTAIKGYADTVIGDLSRGRIPEKDHIDIIGRNTQRLMNLINDLLDLSSLESSELVNKSKVMTEEVTTRLLKQLAPSFQSKLQKVHVSFEAKAVTADPARLEQVLVNLLDNARKYTPETGEISISWDRAPEGVKLKVSDTGPGIPREHLSRLFERFYRVDKSRSRDQGGTGLGLAIVKHIMQAHGGSVTVDSQPGKGSTFICIFPT